MPVPLIPDPAAVLHCGLSVFPLHARRAAWMRSPSVRRATERVTGAVLIALGVRPAFHER
jgi:threonine/homoserine/homoserine lactone efflux protein